MQKYFFTIIPVMIISSNTFCFVNHTKQDEYCIEFHEKSHEMAATLHINFTNLLPEPKEAEKIVKYQLERFGNMLITNNKISSTARNEYKNKNIIGSAWYISNKNFIKPIKIKFQDNLSAYVWIGKTRRIVPFHDYVSFLKKQKQNKKIKRFL
jgi:hypothetical protein